MSAPAGTDWLSDTLRTMAGPPGRALARLGVAPNAVTLAALALNVVAALLIAGTALGPVEAGAVVLAVGFLDAIDGTVARHTGRVTAYGGVLDAVVDRVSESALLVGLLAASLAQGERLDVLACAAALGTFPLVSYVRAKAESLGQRITTGLANRSVRVLALGVGLCLEVAGPVVAALALASLFTALHRMLVLRRLLERSPS